MSALEGALVGFVAATAVNVVYWWWSTTATNQRISESFDRGFSQGVNWAAGLDDWREEVAVTVEENN